MTTDPPYGVSTIPPGGIASTRASARPSVASLNDDRADWTAAWQLFPGAIAYVWHAGAQGADGRGGPRSGGLHDPQPDHLAQAAFRAEPRRLSLGTRTRVVRRPRQRAVARRSPPDHRVGGREPQPVGRHRAADNAVTGHGTQKPVRLFEIPITNHTIAGEAVYDPFCRQRHGDHRGRETRARLLCDGDRSRSTCRPR